MSGGLSHRRPKTIVDQVPPASIRAAARDIACRAFDVHVLAVGTCGINLVVWVGIANRQATQNLSTAISKREVAVQGRMRSRAGRVLLAFLRSATTLRERSSP